MTNEPRPFFHIVEALRRANGLSAKKPSKQSIDEDETQGTDDEDEDQDQRKKTKKKSDVKDQRDGDERREDGDDEEQEEGKPRSALTPAQVTATAQRIVECGRMRRGETFIPARAPPQPRTTPLSEQEARDTARAIVLAGKRRRGELP